MSFVEQFKLKAMESLLSQCKLDLGAANEALKEPSTCPEFPSSIKESLMRLEVKNNARHNARGELRVWTDRTMQLASNGEMSTEEMLQVLENERIPLLVKALRAMANGGAGGNSDPAKRIVSMNRLVGIWMKNLFGYLVCMKTLIGSVDETELKHGDAYQKILTRSAEDRTVSMLLAKSALQILENMGNKKRAMDRDREVVQVALSQFFASKAGITMDEMEGKSLNEICKTLALEPKNQRECLTALPVFFSLGATLDDVIPSQLPGPVTSIYVDSLSVVASMWTKTRTGLSCPQYLNTQHLEQAELDKEKLQQRLGSATATLKQTRHNLVQAISSLANHL